MVALHVFEYGIFALLALFAFTVATIIYNVISNSIFFHQEEIEIIELVGGRRAFTYGQFLLQGSLYGLSAILLVAVLLFLLRSSFDLSGAASGLSVLEATLARFFLSLPWLMIAEIFLTLLISIVSATIALQKYTSNKV